MSRLNQAKKKNIPHAFEGGRDRCSRDNTLGSFAGCAHGGGGLETRAEDKRKMIFMPIAAGREIAATGVDVIYVGALTHSVRALDLALNAAVL
jgi:hypothetical protein